MSQSSSTSVSGNITYGTDESQRPVNWPLIVGLAVAGLIAFLWFKKK